MRDKRTPKDVCGEARVVGVVQFWVESVVVYRLVKVFLLVAPALKNQPHTNTSRRVLQIS